jgi:Ca2+-binding RTX toxin-like protein
VTDAPSPAPKPSAEFTKVFQNWNDTVTFNGTADPDSQIKIYDNGDAKPIGSVKVGSDGNWSYKTSSVVSDGIHNFTATVTDKVGNTGSVPGSAVLGTNGNDVLNSTSGNDLFMGNGGRDTFVFKPNFGADVISDFTAAGRGHDVVQFSKSVFDNFADVLSHAEQSGHDVTIDAGGGNTLTLKDTKLAALDKTDFHFV